MIHASLAPDGALERVCVDSGNPITAVSPGFLTRQNYQGRDKPSRLKMRGVGDAVLSATKQQLITLHIMTTTTRVRTTFWAHVLPGLRPAMLIGVDVMLELQWKIDFESRQLHLQRGISAPLILTAGEPVGQPLPRTSRSEGPMVVRNARTVTIDPGVITPVTIRELPALPEGIWTFEPEREGFLAARIDDRTTFVMVHNETRLQMTLTSGLRLGTIGIGTQAAPSEANWLECVHSVWNTYFAEHGRDSFATTAEYGEPTFATSEEYGDPTFATSGESTELTTTASRAAPDAPPPRPRPPSKSLRPNLSEPHGIGPFGVTIYGDAPTRERYAEVLLRYPRLFTDDGKTADIPEDEWMPIPLVNDWNTAGAKLAHKVYPLGPKDREVVDKIHGKLHDQGRMSWTTQPTPFGFPVFVVWREVDGESKGRAVVDIRGLNKVSTTDAYPIPLQSDIIQCVAGAKFISTVDCASFFHQFLVKKDDRHKLTVISHRGQEQYNVAVMGYKNAPAYAQRQIEGILRKAGCADFSKPFIDDIVAWEKELEGHLRDLDKLFYSLDQRSLTLSGPKAFLGFPSVTLLGQHVNGLGISTSADKLAAINALAFPTTVGDLEIYLGLTGWLRHYIEYYAQRAEPLQRHKTERLKNAPKSGHARKHYTSTARIEPTPDLMASFQAVQAAFSRPTMLVHYDKTRRLYILPDASKARGFGVIVCHLKGDPVMTTTPPRAMVEPILFLSKTLTPTEQRYWPTELEVACLVWTLKTIRWMPEASTHEVTVMTDHASTAGIVKQTALTSSATDKLNNRLTRASLYISQFKNLKICYVPGREHIVPDALSRLPAHRQHEHDQSEDVLDDLVMTFMMDTVAHSYQVTTTLDISKDFKKALQHGYETDQFMADAGEIARNQPDLESFHWRDDLLWYKTRLCIPEGLEGDLFDAAHDGQFHIGPNRLYARMREQYYVRHLDRKVRTYVRHCEDCQRAQTKRHQPYGSLQPIQTSAIPFHTVTMDFIVGLPNDEGYDALLTVTCKFSKRVLLVEGMSTFTAEAWGHRLLDALLRADWGLPTVVITDRDPKFMSELWRTVFERLQTKLLRSTSYHPQTDGQSERTNQTVEIALRYWMAKYPDRAIEWRYALPQLQFVLNNSENASTGVAPNMLLYGFKPREAPDCKPGGPMADREMLRGEAEDAMAFANVSMKKRYDAKHKLWEPKAGDAVMLNLKNYHVPGVTNRKLTDRRVGPFPIEEMYGKQACKLTLPKHWKIHPVISIADLEPLPDSEDPYAAGRTRAARRVQPQNQADATLEPEALLDKRTRLIGRNRTEFTEYLVRWAGRDSSYDTWVRGGDLPVQLVRRYRR